MEDTLEGEVQYCTAPVYEKDTTAFGRGIGVIGDFVGADDTGDFEGATVEEKVGAAIPLYEIVSEPFTPPLAVRLGARDRMQIAVVQ
jgi:hypothetical protein